MFLISPVKVTAQDPPLKTQADILMNRGVELYEAGDKWGALEKFEQARTLYNLAGYPVDEANALNGIGQVRAELGRYAEAVKAFEQAREIYRNIGEQEREAKTLTRIGLLYSRSGKYLNALSIFNQALNLVDENSQDTGRTKNNIGAVYLNQGWHDDAKVYFDEALRIAEAIGDREGAATTLVNIGTLYRKQERYPQALTAYQDAFAMKRELDDTLGEAATLLSIGDVHLEQGDACRDNGDIALSHEEYSKALKVYQDALAIYQGEEHQAGEATALANIAKILFRQEDYAATLQQLLEALTLCREIGDSAAELEVLEQLVEVYHEIDDFSSEAAARTDIGEIYYVQGDCDDAEKALNRTLLLYKYFVDDPQGELRAWILRGETAIALESYDKAVSYFDKALTLLETDADPQKEGRVLTNLGEAQLAQGNYPETADALNQALAIHEALGNQAKKGQTLMLLGEVALQQGDYDDALGKFEEALPLQREASDLAGEARTLVGIGETYLQKTEYTAAMTTFQDALTTYQQAGDCPGEGSAFAKIGEVHHIQEQYIEALDAYQKALDMYCEVDELAGQAYVLEQMQAIQELQRDDAATAATLIDLGAVYRNQGMYTEALDAFDQALTFSIHLSDQAREAQALRQIGMTHRILNAYTQARNFLDQALSVYRTIADQAGEAEVLENIGELELDRAQYTSAKTYYEQALALYQNLGDRAGEGRVLMKIGVVYNQLGMYVEAGEIQRQAVLILAEVDDHFNLILALMSLGEAYEAQGLYWDALEAYRRALGLMTDTSEFMPTDIPALPTPTPLPRTIPASTPIPAPVSTLAPEAPAPLTLTPTPVWTPTPISTMTPAPPPTPSVPPRAEQTPVPTPGITPTPTPTPTATPTLEVSDTPTPTPTSTPEPVTTVTPADGGQASTSPSVRAATATPTPSPTPEPEKNNRHQAERNQEKIDALEQKFEAQQTLDDLAGQIETGEELVDLALLEGQDELAASYLDHLIEAFRQSGETGKELEALNQKGLIHVRQQDYVQAELAFREAAQGDETHRAQAYNNLGVLRYEQRQYDQARDFLDTSLAFAERSQDYTMIATGLNNRALADFRTGQEFERQKKTGEAHELYEQALQNFQQALHYFQLAYKTKETLEDQQSAGTVLNNIGLIYHRLGHYTAALDQYQQALRIIQEVGGRGSESAVLHNIGTVHASSHQYGNALRALQQALHIERNIGNLVDEARTLSQIGYIYEIQSESLLTISSHYMPTMLRFLQQKLGFLMRETALSFYLQAIALQEDIRSGAKLEEFKISIAEGFVNTYQQVVQLLARMNRGKEAFLVSERARARTFLDQLGNRRLDIRKGIEHALLKQEWEQRQEIHDLYQQLQEEQEKPLFVDNTDLIDELKAQIAEQQKQYAELFTQIKVYHPEYASLVSINPPAFGDIQELLDEETTLLSYFVTPQTTLAFVIGRESFEVIELAISEYELTQKVLQTRAALDAEETVDQDLQELYNLLVAPVEASLRTPVIGIVPHGVLHYLPFAALAQVESTERAAVASDASAFPNYLTPSATFSSENRSLAPPRRGIWTPLAINSPPGRGKGWVQKAPYNNGCSTNCTSQYLSEKYTLFALPGASVLPFLQKHRQPEAEQQILAMANKGYPPLKHAEEEAIAIAEFYDTTPVLGEDATGQSFIDSAAESTIIHLSSHAKLNSQSPLSSGFLLHDGYLTIHDLYGLNLKQTDLAVLSACSTQLGQRSRGDDIIALNRAFLYAGATSVVASLWNVDDAATSELMIAFHRHLTHGLSKAEALRQAQIEARVRYPHPRYWAAFVLTGEPGKYKHD